MAASYRQDLVLPAPAIAGFILRPAPTSARPHHQPASDRYAAPQHHLAAPYDLDTQPYGYAMTDDSGRPGEILRSSFDVMFRNVTNGAHKLSIFRAVNLGASHGLAPAVDIALVDERILLSVRPRTTGTMTIFTDPRLVHAGRWHRFVLALRLGIGDRGLAQVEHDGALIANYVGDLG